MEDGLKIITEDSSREDMLAHIRALERRLECDRVFVPGVCGDAHETRPSGLVPLLLPPEERIGMIRDGLDGIGCRDTTIRLLEDHISELSERFREDPSVNPGKAWGYEPPVFPLDACVWFRKSTQEWILEIQGEIGDVHLSCRHTQPENIDPAEVPGLPSLYDLEKTVEAAIAPVIDWYQSDELPPRPLPEILTDLVSDLERDRDTSLRAARAMREALAALEDPHPDPAAALAILKDCLAFDGEDLDSPGL